MVTRDIHILFFLEEGYKFTFGRRTKMVCGSQWVSFANLNSLP